MTAEDAKKRPPFVVEDIDPENTRKGEKGMTFMIKLKFPDGKPSEGFGEYHIISPNMREEVIIKYFYQTGTDEYIFNVQLLNKELREFFDNKYLKPGTQFFMFSSSNGR